MLVFAAACVGVPIFLGDQVMQKTSESAARGEGELEKKLRSRGGLDAQVGALEGVGAGHPGEPLPRLLMRLPLQRPDLPGLARRSSAGPLHTTAPLAPPPPSCCRYWPRRSASGCR